MTKKSRIGSTGAAVNRLVDSFVRREFPGFLRQARLAAARNALCFAELGPEASETQARHSEPVRVFWGRPNKVAPQSRASKGDAYRWRVIYEGKYRGLLESIRNHDKDTKRSVLIAIFEALASTRVSRCEEFQGSVESLFRAALADRIMRSLARAQRPR